MVGYQSLYRKWRPQVFEEVVGQTHVTHTLSNALKLKRVSHAYLFSGPRGTGKTSVARIAAKALNCDKGPTPTPCNKCSNCLEIAEGNSVDVLEIDAASNRGIDEIRDLREKIHFAPSRSRGKVYIVDEVHMLTPEAFNALLKMLEEPPSSVTFILATTELHKVPPTIVSRCQCFEFRQIPQTEVISCLQKIARAEKIKAEKNALSLIAKQAQGSLRDAIGILEQLASFGSSEKSIDMEKASLFLGLIEVDLLFDIVEIIRKKDTAAMLKFVAKLIAGGKDPRQFVKGLIEHFRNLFIVLNSNNYGKIIDVSSEALSRLKDQAAHFQSTQIMHFIEILNETYVGMRWSSDPRLLLEMALVKMTKKEADFSLKGLLVRVEELEKELERTKKHRDQEKGAIHEVQVQERKSEGDESESIEQEPKEKLVVEEEKSEKAEGRREDELKDYKREKIGSKIELDMLKQAWLEVLEHIKKKKISLHSLLLHCQPVSLSENILTLEFPSRFSFHKEKAEKVYNYKVVKGCIEEILGINLELRYVLENTGEEKLDKKPSSKDKKVQEEKYLPKANLVKLVQESFDAKIVDEKSKP